MVFYIKYFVYLLKSQTFLQFTCPSLPSTSGKQVYAVTATNFWYNFLTFTSLGKSFSWVLRLFWMDSLFLTRPIESQALTYTLTNSKCLKHTLVYLLFSISALLNPLVIKFSTSLCSFPISAANFSEASLSVAPVSFAFFLLVEVDPMYLWNREFSNLKFSILSISDLAPPAVLGKASLTNCSQWVSKIVELLLSRLGRTILKVELSLWLKMLVNMTWDFSEISFWSSEFATSLNSLMMLIMACRACLLADLLPRVWNIKLKKESKSLQLSLTNFFFNRESLLF